MTVCPESCFKTSKREKVYLHDSRSFEEAVANLSRFIEDVYGGKRPHPSLSYRLCYVRGPEGIVVELAEQIA